MATIEAGLFFLILGLAMLGFLLIRRVVDFLIVSMVLFLALSLMLFSGYDVVITTDTPVEASKDVTSDMLQREVWYNVTSHSTGARVSDGASPFISRVVFVDTDSVLENKLIDCITIPMQPVGSPPAGTLIEIGTFDGSANLIKEFGTMNVTSLAASVSDYEFCLPGSDAYLIQEGDRIGLKYDDGDSSNFIQIRIDANDPFDGSNTFMQSYTTSWASTTSTDMTAEFTFSIDRTVTSETTTYESETELVYVISSMHMALGWTFFAMAMIATFLWLKLGLFNR